MDGSKSSIISIHALLAESDAIDVFLAVWAVISIHALLAESDHQSLNLPSRPIDFYPRSPCGERPTNHDQATKPLQISIHALLAESDRNGYPHTRQRGAISIHALLAESDG